MFYFVFVKIIVARHVALWLEKMPTYWSLNGSSHQNKRIRYCIPCYCLFLTPFQSDYSSRKPNSQNASRALTSHALSSVVSARNIHSGSILNREDGGCSSGGVSESPVSH